MPSKLEWCRDLSVSQRSEHKWERESQLKASLVPCLLGEYNNEVMHDSMKGSGNGHQHNMCLSHVLWLLTVHYTALAY